MKTYIRRILFHPAKFDNFKEEILKLTNAFVFCMNCQSETIKLSKSQEETKTSAT
jgi:hypothetical protein